MLHSETIALLAAALTKAQGEMPAVPKDSTNPHFKSKFASLDGIVERTKPVLAKHGLAIVQGTSGESAPGSVTVEMMLLHSSGEYLLSNVVMPLAKNDPQGVGSAITYGRRYLIAAMLSLAADEDDDGNASSHKPEAVKAAASKPQPVKLAALDDPNVMPTGDYQGKQLGEVPSKELEALHTFCVSKNNPTRYAARIAALDAELKKRATPDEVVRRMHEAEDKHQAGLKLG